MFAEWRVWALKVVGVGSAENYQYCLKSYKAKLRLQYYEYIFQMLVFCIEQPLITLGKSKFLSQLNIRIKVYAVEELF